LVPEHFKGVMADLTRLLLACDKNMIRKSDGGGTARDGTSPGV
jgi:hypothetical protein